MSRLNLKQIKHIAKSYVKVTCQDMKIHQIYKNSTYNSLTPLSKVNHHMIIFPKPKDQIALKIKLDTQINTCSS